MPLHHPHPPPHVSDCLVLGVWMRSPCLWWRSFAASPVPSPDNPRLTPTDIPTTGPTVTPTDRLTGLPTMGPTVTPAESTQAMVLWGWAVACVIAPVPKPPPPACPPPSPPTATGRRAAADHRAGATTHPHHNLRYRHKRATWDITGSMPTSIPLQTLFSLTPLPPVCVCPRTWGPRRPPRPCIVCVPLASPPPPPP